MSRFIVSFLLLLFAAATVYFGVLPQWKKIGSEQLEIKRLRALSEELVRVQERRDALRQVYNEIPQANLEKLYALTPKEPETTEALVDFETLTERNGLSLDQIDFAEESGSVAAAGAAGAQLYGTIPVSMNLRGSYEALRSFLAAVERNLRLVDASEIDFNFGQGTLLTIRFKGKMYHRR